MALLVPSNGASLMLNAVLNGGTNPTPPLGNTYLWIYSNDISPTTTNVVTNFAQWGSPITLSSGTWTVTGGTSPAATATYPSQTFTVTASCSIYGYLVTDNVAASNGNVLWAERFPSTSGYVITSSGTITITPQITMT